MNAEQERAFEAKAEKHFKSHRDTPCGRNFVFWEHEETEENKKNYRKNFDKCFPNSPGAGI